MKLFEEANVASVATNIKRPVHHHFARFAENIAIVSESVAECVNPSRHSQE